MQTRFTADLPAHPATARAFLPELEAHPLAEAYAPMNAEEFDALVDSVRSIGVQNPVMLLEGRILDGRHRYRASVLAGRYCPVVQAPDDFDPQAFVLAQNQSRRHLTAGQRALAAVAVYQWREEGNRGLGKPSTECKVARAKTNDELAVIAAVSPRVVGLAKSVVRHCTAEVQGAARMGTISLNRAVALSKLPREQQGAALKALLHQHCGETTMGTKSDRGPTHPGVACQPRQKRLPAAELKVKQMQDRCAAWRKIARDCVQLVRDRPAKRVRAPKIAAAGFSRQLDLFAEEVAPLPLDGRLAG